VLVARYEELRAVALGASQVASSGRGLALLMRKGMAKWMDAWSSWTAPPRRDEHDHRGAILEQDEFVMVMTEVAIAAALQGGEVREV